MRLRYVIYLSEYPVRLQFGLVVAINVQVEVHSEVLSYFRTGLTLDGSFEEVGLHKITEPLDP